MTVEERIGSAPRQVAPPDRFPVGMRVLAVDDDPTCLRVLENLLRLCQYHVTTTNQAITALKLLRENRDKFDLVISDVHMPDMDGFKLLELVGLEMDLPVIMLSANSDTKAVMKGITHGACDYLLKPVRLEELKNIWQHVVRRRKFETRDTSLRDHGDRAEKYQHPKSDVRLNPDDETPDSNCKFNRKRKDQNEEEEDSEENGHECEDPSSQKKPRVVWSPELHKKFVDAVNHLGIDKAVPKRILDLMNVERLTRENVASHLQKFRLYLKRIQAATSQQANIFAALGGRDCYLPMGSMDGIGNIHALARPRQFPALTSFQTGATVGRMNSPTSIGFQGLSSNGMIQLGQANNNIGNSNHVVRNIGQINLSGVPEGNVTRGLPTINHFQQHKTANETSCQFPGYLSNLGVPSDSNNLCCNNSGNIFTLQGQSGELDIQSSSRRTLENDPFHISVGISHLPDSSTCNDTWPDAAPLGGYSANTLPLNTSLGDENPSSSIILKDRISLIGSKCDNSRSASINNVMVSTVLEQLASTSQYHSSGGADVLSIPTGVTESLRISDFPTASNSQQKLEDHRQDQCARPTLEYGSHLNSLPTAHGISIADILNVGQDGMLYDIKIEASGINQSSLNAPFFEQQTETNNYQMKAKNDSFMPPSKLPSGLSSNNCNSYEELMNTMLNAESRSYC